MRVEIASDHPTVVRTTSRIFDALDSRGYGADRCPAGVDAPLDPLSALLALRNVFLTVGCVAIDAGLGAQANRDARAAGKTESAVELNRQMVLEILDELREVVVAYRTCPQEDALR